MATPQFDHDLSAMLISLEGNNTLDTSSPIEILGMWESRTALLYRCDIADRAVIIKVFQEGPALEGRNAANEIDALDEILAAVDDVDAGGVIGWTTDPPSLWMPYLAGWDLKTVVREAQQGKRHLGGSTTDLFTRAGIILRTLHNSRPVDPTITANVEQAMKRLTDTAGALRLDVKRLDRVTAGIEPLGLFGDYTPANLRVRVDGVLSIIDPPTEPIVGLPHEDLARFRRGIRTAIQPPWWVGSTSEANAYVIRLMRAFLNGYETSGLSGSSQDDQWLMALHDAVVHRVDAKAGWKRRNAGQTMLSLRQLRRSRAELRRPTA